MSEYIADQEYLMSTAFDLLRQRDPQTSQTELSIDSHEGNLVLCRLGQVLANGTITNATITASGVSTVYVIGLENFATVNLAGTANVYVKPMSGVGPISRCPPHSSSALKSCRTPEACIDYVFALDCNGVQRDICEPAYCTVPA